MPAWLPWNGPSGENSRWPLWLGPTLASLAAIALGALLTQISPTGNGVLDPILGDVDAARALLQVTATSVMTATTLTFSLTVVALQLASQQFSPRLLREFTRDPITKRVLSVLAAAFAYAVVVVTSLDGKAPVPGLAVLVTGIFALASLGAILSFITHIVRIIRVDSMMLMVHDDTTRAVDRFYPPYDEEALTPDDVTVDEARAHKLHARKSGFVQKVNTDQLIVIAKDIGGFVRLEVRPGDHVVRETPMASVWVEDPAGTDLEDVEERVQSALTIGYERTMDQDAAFGFRQLEDVAVKAMSPSINDPVTADHAVGHMADLLVRLMGCRLGATVHVDEDDVPRAIVPDRDVRYYLDLACAQLRRFGAAEPTVLMALLRMLRDVAVVCRDDHQREEVRRAAKLVATEGDELRKSDLAAVDDLLERVELALAGDLVEAYADRSGETRSI